MRFWNGHAMKPSVNLDYYDLECSDKAYEESLKYYKKEVLMKQHEYAIEILRFMKKEIKEKHVGWMGEREAKENRRELSLAIKVLKKDGKEV